MKTDKPGINLLYILLITGLSLFIFYGISIFTAVIFFDTGITEIINATLSPSIENAPILKYLQALQSTGIFIVPPIVFVLLIKQDEKDYLLLKKKPNLNTVLLITALLFAIIPLVNLMVDINQKINLPESLNHIERWMKSHEEINNKITKLFIRTESPSDLFINLIILAVIPAIGEELMFRGTLQPIFGKLTKNKHWGIIISAIIFSAIHMQFYGFFARFALGVCFGYLVLWTGSLWPAIIAHFVNNGFQVIYFGITGKYENSELETIGYTDNLFYLSLISAVLTTIILYSIKAVNNKKLTKDF